MKSKKLIIFDLDGVLLDSKKNMKLSWSYVQQKHKVKKSFDNYSKYIGLPFQKILKKMNISNNRKNIQKTYSEASLLFFDTFKLFRGSLKVINLLKKNYNLAIFTSKDKKRTDLILKKNKIKISTIITPGNNLRGKPYPDAIFYIMRKLNIKNKKNVIYVGDTKTDFYTAKKAKINYIQANYGFFSFKHKCVINNITQLPKILKIINF